MCLMQLSYLVKKFVSLTWSETNAANVVNALAVLIEVIVAEVRLDGKRSQQRVCHERTWKPTQTYADNQSINQYNSDYTTMAVTNN